MSTEAHPKLTASPPLPAPYGSKNAKNCLWAAQNLERMAMEETDPELRRLWLRASSIGRAKAGLPNYQLDPDKTFTPHEKGTES